jgi:hypothetical protein
MRISPCLILLWMLVGCGPPNPVPAVAAPETPQLM